MNERNRSKIRKHRLFQLSNPPMPDAHRLQSQSIVLVDISIRYSLIVVRKSKETAVAIPSDSEILSIERIELTDSDSAPETNISSPPDVYTQIQVIYNGTASSSLISRVLPSKVEYDAYLASLKQLILPKLTGMTAAQYDDAVKEFQYVWCTDTQAKTPKRHNYSALETAGDFEGLQHVLCRAAERGKNGKYLTNMVLFLQASIRFTVHKDRVTSENDGEDRTHIELHQVFSLLLRLKDSSKNQYQNNAENSKPCNQPPGISLFSPYKTNGGATPMESIVISFLSLEPTNNCLREISVTGPEPLMKAPRPFRTRRERKNLKGF